MPMTMIVISVMKAKTMLTKVPTQTWRLLARPEAMRVTGRLTAGLMTKGIM